MTVLRLLEVLVVLFLMVSFLMICKYIVNIFRTQLYIKNAKREKVYEITRKVSVAIIIPVLREQNVICDTIDYFAKLKSKNLSIQLVIAGTKREYESLEHYGFSVSTKKTIEDYIRGKEYKEDFKLHVFEADDMENGDRASQLNFAVKNLLSIDPNIDIIGVYDADSRPTIETILEVAERFLINGTCSYQQPAFFMQAANQMTKNHENPILIANALYQNTWSIVSEIPMWISYGKNKGVGNNYFYCIGHGEFFPTEVYKSYNFPEREVTDGIQIGYRLSMSGKCVDILDNYCSDDVPHNIKTLILQHKRWFGGCMRLKEAYKWCRESVPDNELKILPVIGGYWGQFRWAYTVPLFVITSFISVFLWIMYGYSIFFILMAILLFIYSYVLPAIAIAITPIESKTSIVSFLCIPIAIAIKCVGPNLYFFNTIIGKKNTYGKVER